MKLFINLALSFFLLVASVAFAGKVATKASVLPTHKITVQFQEAKVKEALGAVMEESGFRFKFDKNISDNQRKINR